ncbi:hypothetical protein CPC16_010396 [Podila verticillata]|nr:hypothetical protein CPC16_010396 [Podila verticillata]
MVLLLFAVPLSKNWLGIHYWKPPPPEDLPVELEYIPYEDLKDRFEQLNKIARPDYPTYWPNVAAFFALAGITAAVTWGITTSGHNLGTMAQGACFVIPILIVIWVKVRKETKARARKRFKHRSQKLLRVWTNEDVASHAIQWKLRLRSKSAARRWIPRQPNLPPTRTNIVEEDTVHLDQHVVVSTTHPEQATQEQPTHVTQQQEQPVQPDQHDHDARTPSEQLPGTFSTSSLPPPPPPSRPQVTIHTPTISEMYYSLRANHRRFQIPRPLRRDSGNSISSTAPLRSREDGSSSEHEGSSNPIWVSFVVMFKGIWCCMCFFQERKYWLIEIAIRDYQVDEYALMVPSPVYCDYRLPGYEDVVAAGAENGTGSSGTSPPANSSRVGLHRYIGMPPAYESGSENDSDDEDGDEDGHRDGRSEDVSNRSEIVVVVSRPEDPPSSSTSPPSSSSLPLPMAMVASSELAAVVLGPSSRNRSLDELAQSTSARSSRTSLSLDPDSLSMSKAS